MSLLGCVLLSHLGLIKPVGLSKYSQYWCWTVTVLRQGLCVLWSHRMQHLNTLQFFICLRPRDNPTLVLLPLQLALNPCPVWMLSHCRVAWASGSPQSHCCLSHRHLKWRTWFDFRF